MLPIVLNRLSNRDFCCHCGTWSGEFTYLESDESMTRLEAVEDAHLEEEEGPLLLGGHVDDEHGGVHRRLDHAVPEGGPPAQEVSVVVGVARRTDD